MVLMILSFFLFFNSCWSEVLVTALAQVKDHVVTTRETAIHEALVSALGYDFGSPEKISSRDQVVREWLLFYEALGFYSHPVKDSEQIKKWKLAKDLSMQSGVWRKLEMSDDELKEKVRRHMEVQRLYDFKKKASKTPVSVIEIENEYRQNQKHYQSMNVDKAKNKIHKYLEQKKTAKQLNEWFRVLEQKYKVRYFSEQSL